MFRRSSYLTLSFHGLTALATLTIAGVAVWGFFFTNIPEDLIRQLRTGIADTQEQLSNLRQERRALLAEIRTARDQLKTAEQDREGVQSEVSKLHAEKNQAKEQIAQLRLERRAYFENISQIVLDQFFASIDKDFNKLRQHVEMARTYPDFLEWYERWLEFDKIQWKRRYKEFNEAWEILRREKPLYWGDRAVLKALSEPEIHLSEAYGLTISEFKQEVTWRSNKMIENANLIISTHLDDDYFSLLIHEDQSQIRNKIRAFLSKYNETLSSPLVVALPPGWTIEDLVAAAVQVGKTHNEVRVLVTTLRNEISLQGSDAARR